MGVNGCQTNWLSQSRSTADSRASAIVTVPAVGFASAGEQVFDRLSLTAKLRQGDVDLFAGEVVVLEPLRNLPAFAVGRERIAEDQSRVDAVAAVTVDSRAERIARSRRRDEALDRVDARVG